MEALSLASTFATLIGFSMQLYGTCKYYVDAARGDCPSDLKLILIETSSLEATLRTVQDILHASDNRREDEQRLQRQIGKPLDDCKSCIEQLIKLVPKPMLRDDDGKLSKRDKAKIVLNALAWGTAGKKSTCDMLLRNLRAHKATLTLGLTTELSHEVKKIGEDVAHVKSSVNTVQAKLDAHQRSEVYKWLEQVNPSRNHNNTGQLHEIETGQWLTRSNEWKSWIGGSGSRFLWIYGIPGSGKTVLAYTMVEQLRTAARADKTLGTAYYYCYYARNKDEAVPFLTWIICQLCRQSDFIPVILNDLFKDGCEPTIKDLLECLEHVLTRFKHAYIVVDAVDESSPRKNLVDVISILGSDKRFAKLSLAVTSREIQDIEAAFKPRSVSMSMANNGVMQDISVYVKTALQGSRYSTWGQPLRDMVAKVLPAKAAGMFRYAACQLELLAECDNPTEVKRELDHLPSTLAETYERILGKIEPKHRDETVRALALIIGALETAAPYSPRTSVRAHHKKLPPFALSMRKTNEIYFDMALSTAAQFSGTPNISSMAEDSNGDPVDFRLYALRRTRIAMFWNRAGLASSATNKTLLVKLLDPYHPSYRGLQLLGHDGHHDESHLDLFEWLPKFNPQADATEKAAAHLTMIVGISIPSLVTEFLHGMSEQQKSTLFNTKMQVIFPAEWSIFRRRGTYDPKAISVTLADFYDEGRRRGYDTATELKMLRNDFGAYTQQAKKDSKSGTGSTPSSTPGRSTPTTGSKGPASSSRDAAPTGGRAPSRLGPDAASTSTASKRLSANGRTTPSISGTGTSGSSRDSAARSSQPPPRSPNTSRQSVPTSSSSSRTLQPPVASTSRSNSSTGGF